MVKLDLDLDPDPHSEKLLDLDPHKMKADPQPWGQSYHLQSTLYSTGTKLKLKFKDPERETVPLPLQKFLEFLFKCFGSGSGSIQKV